jgi:RNA polymerase sigma factor (sigma-70 family)
MGGETTTDLQNLIERLRSGDQSARRALLDRVYHRLRRIAALVLREDFARLRPHHELDSIVDEAWAQLMKALESTAPATAHEFYQLVYRKVRHVLLDLARREGRHEARRHDDLARPDGSGAAVPFDREDTTHDPSRLAFWTEFHQEVEKLPENERLVFDFHYFAEFPQAEIAQLLDLHPKQVSRLWIAATFRLARRLDGIQELL